MHIHEEDREGSLPLSTPSFPLQLSLTFRMYFFLFLSIYLSRSEDFGSLVAASMERELWSTGMTNEEVLKTI